MGNIDVISIYRYRREENIDISVLIFENIAIPSPNRENMYGARFEYPFPTPSKRFSSAAKLSKNLPDWLNLYKQDGV